MRTALFATLIALAFAGCNKATDTPAPSTDAKGAAGVIAAATAMEVGCAKCVYKQAGVASCEAAVKLGDKVMLLSVPGFDAHKEGLCGGAKKATITGGKEEGGKYVASKVELVK